ncbi:MAG: GlsB/YeaQ/YmgE family stress response membrane protein [Rhodosalinus sp.]
MTGLGFESVLAMLLTGLVAGWLAAKLVRGGGLGLIGNMAVGVAGAFLAGVMLPVLGFGTGGGVVVTVLQATLGAIVVLVLIRLIRTG